MDLNYADDREDTAIHWAAYRDDIFAIKCLAEAGCNIDVRSTYGRTPFLEACSNNAVNAACTLLSLGADHAATDSSGNQWHSYSMMSPTRLARVGETIASRLYFCLAAISMFKLPPSSATTDGSN